MTLTESYAIGPAEPAVRELTIGQALAEAAAECPERIAMEMRRTPVKEVRHVIARGDTLSEIAERYNVSPSAIRSANKLSGDRIRVGQTLNIPIYAGT